MDCGQKSALENFSESNVALFYSNAVIPPWLTIAIQEKFSLECAGPLWSLDGISRKSKSNFRRGGTSDASVRGSYLSGIWVRCGRGGWVDSLRRQKQHCLLRFSPKVSKFFFLQGELSALWSVSDWSCPVCSGGGDRAWSGRARWRETAPVEEAATHVGGAGGHGRRDGRSRAGDAEPLVVLMIRQLSPPLQYMPRVGGGTR